MFNFTGAAIIPGDTTNIQASRTRQCHKWFNVLDDLQQNLFNGGQCNDLARQALRITFHDAIGYSLLRCSRRELTGNFSHCLTNMVLMSFLASLRGGGADGSLIKFASIELKSPANKGLETIVHALKHIADRHNVTYGDIIQFAGAVGFSNCPGSPRLAFYAGRPDAAAPAPPNLFPSPMDSAQKILTRMADAGFSAEIRSSSSGTLYFSAENHRSYHLRCAIRQHAKLFDTQFYLETLLKGTAYPGKSKYKSKGEAKSALSGQFRIASDAAIARHPLMRANGSHLLITRRACAQFVRLFIGHTKVADVGTATRLSCWKKLRRHRTVVSSGTVSSTAVKIRRHLKSPTCVHSHIFHS
ncbi:Versatile peroxidase VPL1 [Grifola frondosa]|uniref:Peroxidase n=1 Tax=Grifola frondosa TaxID=5627 RepID=A0A1C7M4L4_GRIFR|nr:Versatile peroxidase VPL1 [Grifola frondosa]